LNTGGKARRKETLGRPRCNWVDNIKIDLREIVWGSMDWIHLAQDRTRLSPVSTVMSLGVP
jgi:hypothetical protein